MSQSMDLADKGLLMHLLGNYKWHIENEIKQVKNGVIGNKEKDIPRLELEMEMIERANEIIQEQP